MADTIKEIDGMPLRWGSPDGVIHAVEGARIPNDQGELLLWTICGKHDVPANTGTRSRETVTCPDCHQ